MDCNDANLPIPAEQGWWHTTITFPDDAGVNAKTATALDGQRFHFLRKQGKLRLRTEHPAADVLDRLITDKLITGWVAGIYEPEVDAFGGPEGMAIAHELFCADSPAALAETGDACGRERCILLISTLNRAAGLDPFEIGDVWAKLADLRPPINPPGRTERAAAITAMRRLMNADAAQRETTEPHWSERVTAFEAAGRRLSRLATAGSLTRGLRVVLAHHAIFAFNRAGTSPAEQAAAAWLGRHAAFDDDEATTVLTIGPEPVTPNLKRMETTITTTADPAELRDALVTRLTESGHLRSTAIINAFREVERHAFVPDTDPQTAYIEGTVAIKRDDAGETLSCISAPSVVATQLEQLDVKPGHKVLEAGAATGYNAALLGRLAEPGGHVWTVDVDQDLVNNAAAHLAAAGRQNVTALVADGAAGLPEHGPYDRIQFTVGAGDVPVGVLEQVAAGGRLVIPMRIRGSISRSFAFERDGDTWITVSCDMATFVPLRKGVCDDVYTLVRHKGEGTVRLETFSEQEVEPWRRRRPCASGTGWSSLCPVTETCVGGSRTTRPRVTWGDAGSSGAVRWSVQGWRRGASGAAGSSSARSMPSTIRTCRNSTIRSRNRWTCRAAIRSAASAS